MNENTVAALHALWRADGYMTTSEVAKEVFDPEDDAELRNADRKVRHYFEDSYAYLTVVQEKEGVKQFDIRDDRVTFGAGMMRVVNEEEEMTLGYGLVLVFERPDEEPEIVPIEPVEELDDPESAVEAR